MPIVNDSQSKNDQGSTSANKDLLIITFIGSFAANVGTVLLVGLALALVHLTYRFLHQRSLIWLLIVALPILLALVPVEAVYILIISQSRNISWKNPGVIDASSRTKIVIGVSPRTKILVLLMICPMILLETLLLIGLAAGVK